jgi:hypothetical protein
LADKQLQIEQTAAHLLQKTKKWEYQKEHRFILHRGSEPTIGEYEMPVNALDAIILGRRLNEKECKQVVGWLRSGPWKPTPRIYCRDPIQVTYILT